MSCHQLKGVAASKEATNGQSTGKWKATLVRDMQSSGNYQEYLLTQFHH